MPSGTRIIVISSSLLMGGGSYAFARQNAQSEEGTPSTGGRLRLTGIAPGVPADSNDDLGGCQWERSSTTVNTSIAASCESDQRVLTGACISSGTARVEASYPYEGGALADLPEDGDNWYNTTGTSGWSCFYSTTGNPSYAIALCCGS